MLALVNIFLIMSNVLIPSLCFPRFHYNIIAGIGFSVTPFEFLHSTYLLHRVHYMHLSINPASPHSLSCHLVIRPETPSLQNEGCIDTSVVHTLSH